MENNLNLRLIIVSFCLLIFACSESANIEIQDNETGSISFQVQWRGAPTLANDIDAGTRALNCAASEIETVTFDILDANDTLLATDSWPCIQGQGIVYGVPAGTDRRLIVEGTDDRNRVRYRGEVAGITVVAGQHEDVETVVCDPVEYIDVAFLQYRKYGDDAPIYKGWIDFLINDNPTDMSAITQINLKNASNSSILMSGNAFYAESQYFGAWNDDTSNVDYSGPNYYSGFSINFPAETSLPAGNYTYEATTNQDDILSTTLYFPGETAISIVDSASMSQQWLIDDSLHLSWTTPTGDFDQLRVVLLDQDYHDVLYIHVPVNAEEVTVPSDLIQDISYFKNPSSINWTVQTRYYSATSDNNQYARGYSNWVNFAWQPSPVNSLGMAFVNIPAGTFSMGSPDGVSEFPIGSTEIPPAEPGRADDESPHQVTLTQSLYMQTTEVTQEQWQAVMGSNPSSFSGCGSDCPVENVSWNDIQTFLSTLNGMGQGTYRLPTEAEWEYAARAGSTTAFANGAIAVTNCGDDANLDYMGWYCFNSGDTTHPVAQKQPNAWGLYDMHGNVAEYCQDWYGDYPAGPVSDPAGAVSGDAKVHRGGAWGSWVGTCRSAHRYSRPATQRDIASGFRLVREP
jgi:formylglycine-generating enzyme required for sulfatase activity